MNRINENQKRTYIDSSKILPKIYLHNPVLRYYVQGGGESDCVQDVGGGDCVRDVEI